MMHAGVDRDNWNRVMMTPCESCGCLCFDEDLREIDVYALPYCVRCFNELNGTWFEWKGDADQVRWAIVDCEFSYIGSVVFTMPAMVRNGNLRHLYYAVKSVLASIKRIHNVGTEVK